MNDLVVEFTALDLKDYVVFSRNREDKEWTQITEPGTYKADAFATAGNSWSSAGEIYRAVGGTCTVISYSEAQWRYMPGLPRWCQEIIGKRGFYTGGGGNRTKPGRKVFFNNHLFDTLDAAKRQADWLMGSSSRRRW